jgi:hypothetical protein
MKKAAENLLTYTPLTLWDQQQAQAKLDELYNSALALADDTIRWYHSYRTRKGKWAKGIRVIAVALLVCSTLMPYFASITSFGTKSLYIGYLLAAIGGGLLLLDRYYGYSTSWIRFVLTGMSLEAQRNSFVEHWQIVYIQNQPLSVNSFCFLVNEISMFREAFSNAVKTETETWALEFEQSFKDLATALKSQTEQLKTQFEQRQQTTQSTLQTAVQSVAVDIPAEVFEEAIVNNFERWKVLYNVVAVAHGKKYSDGNLVSSNALVFIPPIKLVEGQAEFNLIPKGILYTASNGVTYNLPTDVRPAGGRFTAVGQTPALLCDRDIPKRPGCSISRKDVNDDTGTLGLKVFKGVNAYVLSCYHVLCAPELALGRLTFSAQTQVGSNRIVSPSREDSNGGSELGSVEDGELNNMLDGAIMAVDGTISISNKICSLDRRPGEPLEVVKKHADMHHAVISVGRTSGILKGAIEFHSSPCDVDYVINGKVKTITFQQIILTDQLALPGDSGAAVTDNDNNVIGILVASTKQMSCVIPIQRLLTRFTITLNPKV